MKTEETTGALEIDGVALPETVTHVQVGEKSIYLVGTAHVSKESVEDVRKAVEAVKPDSIAVELCCARHKAMIDRDNWKNMNILKVIKEKKAVFLLSQLIMSSFYRKLGDQLGVQPGAEMMEGVQLAQDTGAELVLADRDVEITLKRVWGGLSFWRRIKLMFQLVQAVFLSEEIDEQTVEEIKQKDQLEHALNAFAESYPEIKERLIDERDIFLARKIAAAPGKKIVAAVGAGHVKGIVKHIHDDGPLDDLVELPPKALWPRIVQWAIPVVIVGLIVYGFFKGGAEYSMDAVYIWIGFNAVLAAAGAALALAHPLTVLATFIAAPITSLNPMIAAGWVSGIVQAKMKSPTVADLEDLPTAIMSVGGFWRNPVTRILLVVVLANLGSSLGTFISGSLIAVHVL